MSFSLVERAAAWYEAGQLSERVLNAAVEARSKIPETRTTVFAHLPARSNGAYVFSSGFREALLYRTGVPPDRILESEGDVCTIGGASDTVWFVWTGREFEQRDSE